MGDPTSEIPPSTVLLGSVGGPNIHTYTNAHNVSDKYSHMTDIGLVTKQFSIDSFYPVLEN